MLETFKDAVSGAFLKVSSLFTRSASQSKRKREESTARDDCSFTASPSKKLRGRSTGLINMALGKPKQPMNFSLCEGGSTVNADSSGKVGNGPTREFQEVGTHNRRADLIVTSQPLSISSNMGRSRSIQSSPRSSLLPPSEQILPVRTSVPRYCLEYYKSCSQPCNGTAAESRKGLTNLSSKSKMSVAERFGLSQGRQQSSNCSVASSASRESTINRCIRIKEKENYSRLLEQFTCKVFPFCGSTSPAAIIHETRIEPVEQCKSPIMIEVTSRAPVEAAEKPLQDHPAREIPQLTESTASPASTADAVPKIPQESSRAEPLPQSRALSPDFVPSLRKRFSAKERERQKLAENERFQKEVTSKEREDFEAGLEERFHKQISLVAEVSEVSVALPKITKEMDEIIRRSLQTGPLTVVCKAFDADITTQDLVSLTGQNWLNDQIINTYFTMIMERSKNPQFPRSYAFNSFFYPKLVNSGHAGLRRWTRKVDIFSYDLLLVPVHLGLHWCTAVISVKDKFIHYYDSLGGKNEHCLNVLLQYLADESLDKKKVPLEVDQWTTKCVQGIPQQSNGSDCGVFSCKFAEYASRGAKFTFSQKDMPYFRRRMIYEIVEQNLLHP